VRAFEQWTQFSAIDQPPAWFWAALRPENASALRLTQLEDLDANAAASALGVSPGTVKVWMHRARQQLGARTAGVEGRWVSDEPVSPASLVRRLYENGHRDLADKVLTIVGVDSAVRWELHLGGWEVLARHQRRRTSAWKCAAAGEDLDRTARPAVLVPLARLVALLDDDPPRDRGEITDGNDE
jgi:predicted DNA-binding protein (UPF0251 family)